MSKRMENLLKAQASLLASAKITEVQIKEEALKEVERREKSAEKKKLMTFALIEGTWEYAHSKLIPEGTPTMKIETMEVDGFFGHKVVAENLPNVIPPFPNYIPTHRTYNGFLLREGYVYDNGNYIKK